MIKAFQILSVFLIFCINSYSQLSTPGTPESFLLKNKSELQIPVKDLNFIDTSYLMAEERVNGITNRYGVVQQLYIDLKKDGIATNIEGKGTIWQYELKSGQALSLGIRFSNFHLPPGATVFIYSEDHHQLAGAFTSIDNLDSKQLPIADFKGKHVIIEYFEPLNPSFQGEIIIGSVAMAYKNLFFLSKDRIGINCPQGANWQDVKHAVCLMSFNDSVYLYFCTGFLINNVREDGTPYFQTASHCVNNSIAAATLITYFNYENNICANDSLPFTPSLSGSTLVANNDFSDFTLLMLSQYPPETYIPYYAGWNAIIEYAQSGTCIHHPSRGTKCISGDTLSPINYPFSIDWHDNSKQPVSSPGTHWEVIFSYGNVEGGSSGAPLFNENQLAIGQLHGGTPNASFFGKLSVSWNHSDSITKQLKHWLDPDSLGILSLHGSYIRKKPVTSFSSGLRQACNGEIVKFKDLSKHAPTHWNWAITPSSFEFVNGTDSSSKNPQLVFKSTGNYTVTLITNNSYGSDTLSILDYISSIYSQVSLSGLPTDKIVCGCNLNHYSFLAKGAKNYNFSIERPDKILSETNFDSLFLSLKPVEKKNGSFNSWVKVIGTWESCITSDSLMFQISMPPNDDIENAIQLLPGRNAGYSNFCASVQYNEPYPPGNSCYASDSWCPFSGNSDTLLRNTIWFRFIGPPSGLLTIDTHGFDDKIALYFADSQNDILSGNPAKFKIVAANDNRSVSDATAFLQNISVEPFGNYWLQLDGDNKQTGICTIDLLTNGIEIYPNPSSGIFNIIIANKANGIAEVEILSTVGTVLLTNRFNISIDSNRVTFDLSSLPQGIYFVQAKINGTVSKAKLMLVK